MVMKNIKNKYQPDPYKIIINTCLLLFFQPVYGSSLSEPVANGKKALSRGSTLTKKKKAGPRLARVAGKGKLICSCKFSSQSLKIILELAFRG
jgi:hypothetical protein